ncbi:hypothetical protein ACIU1J_04150 [Azospirillum doebereinerae]|uniref:hypothetical protein n=1 Tax=Azospirillum doebereinerae TaxID=92933 RepID=UPI001EE503D9|nr:hypothetical protein [Azospirillum doebereinerae]MCG5243257.1 hypothetical protein [Azospirillum doebereinerae]
MPSAIDVFGGAVLVLGLTALGLSVIFEATRLSATAGRQALVRRRIQAREREKIDQKRSLDEALTEEAARQATLDGLLTERSRVLAATNSLKMSKIEMVHEVGDPVPGAVLYQAELRTGGDSVRPEQRRIVFAREIWERGNIAHVWAETPEAAMAAIQRAFNAKSGIVATRLQRAASASRPAEQADGAPPPKRTPDRPPLRVAGSSRAA